MTTGRAGNDAVEDLLAQFQVATCDYGDEGVDGRIQRLLEVLRTFLHMDVVFVGRVEGDQRYIAFAAQADDQAMVTVGAADPLEQTWCHQILLGRIPNHVPDAAVLQHQGLLPDSPLHIGTFLSVPLILADGHVYGTLCCIAREVVHDVSDDAVHHLTSAARLLGHRLLPVRRVPVPALAEGLAGATAFFASGPAMEPLRAFLAQVRSALGMDIAFISQLTADDRLVFALVEADPESGIPLTTGDAAPVRDSYCKLLAEGNLAPVVHDVLTVPELARLPATRHMGIRTYVSSAIRLGTGQVVGTVCCFSQTVRDQITEADQSALQAIADAIALSIRPDGRLRSPIWPMAPA